MKKILFIAFLSLCNLAFSQSKGTVTGTVTDKEMSGEALPFANVFIKGTSIGGTTDMDGKYTLSVPTGNQTIVFSFVGYQTIEKQIVIKENETTTVNQELGANEVIMPAPAGRQKAKRPSSKRPAPAFPSICSRPSMPWDTSAL